MRRRAVLAALLGLAACGHGAPPWPAPPPVALDLKLTLSAQEAPLLQPVTAWLDLYRAADLEVELAPEVDAADFLAEVTTLPEVPFGPGFWRRTILVLRAVRGPGELAVPSFTARAGDGSVAATTPAQKLVVTSSLAGHGAGLEAPRGPFEARPGLVPFGLVVGGWALLLALLWYATRRGGFRGAPGETALPPHTKALRALQRLRGAPRTTAADIEAFYVEVSAVLRVYLEERFGLRAPEQTTEEFLRALESGAALAREHRAELQQFLSQCDLVKFAAVRPAERDHLATFAIAEAFVERTRADRADGAVAAEGAA